jgi:hypothetical protein
MVFEVIKEVVLWGTFPKFHIQRSANNPKTIAVERKEKQKKVVIEIRYVFLISCCGLLQQD